VPLPRLSIASTKRCKDAGSSDSCAIGATEDAAACRVIAGERPGGRRREKHFLRLPPWIRTTVDNVSTQVSLEGVEVQAFIHFVRAHASVVRGLDRELVADHGLTINDYEVLLRLSRAEDRMMRRVDLAQQVLLTPSGITRLLDGLQRCGYVEKAACDSDARVVYAKLTDSGHEKLAAATEDHAASIRALFRARFSDEDLRTLCDFLERLQPETSD
jgi:DNA-binding MarR family transcriptional regulator